PYVGRFRQPLGQALVEVLEAAEAAAIEEVSFDVAEGAFALALRLRTSASARPYLVTVVRGERQETGVVDRLVALVTGYHDLHVVVQAGGGHAAKVLKGPHVFTDRRLEILGLHEAQVLPPRITENVTEQVDPPPALLREVDLVVGIIHLRLLPFPALESHHR